MRRRRRSYSSDDDNRPPLPLLLWQPMSLLELHSLILTPSCFEQGGLQNSALELPAAVTAAAGEGPRRYLAGCLLVRPSVRVSARRQQRILQVVAGTPCEHYVRP